MTTREIATVLVLCCLLAAAAIAEEQAGHNHGLSVSNGELLLEGEPYCGVGANYFSLFYRRLKDPYDESWKIGLERLAKAKTPFVRFMACGFWPVDCKLYMDRKQDHFQLLDEIVREAEKQGIGLVPSLFWHMPNVPDIVGEPIDQLGNPDSKSIAFITNYTAEVVQRYRDSPAIWAWELGNEYNLAADLPNAAEHRPAVWPKLETALERTSRDELTSEAMLTIFDEFAKTVRRYDSNRLIITGNSLPRVNAWHNVHKGTWDKDTPGQFKEMLQRDNPDPFGVLCVHLYRNSGQGQTASISELVAMLRETSLDTGKPLFIGEFGAPKTLGPEKEKARFLEILNALERNSVPLSAFWVFDHAGQNKDWNITFENERSYMLQLVADANQRMRTSMRKRKTDNGWIRSRRALLTNFNNMYNPCVVETGGEYRYRMWFFGWAADQTNSKFPGCDAIYHARSKDLEKWEIYSRENTWDSTMNPELWIPVLHASDRWYEAWHVGDPSVVLEGGKYYMAYSATSRPFSKRAGFPATMVQCIMGAVSSDGIHWKRTDQPLLIREEDTANPKPDPTRIGDFHRPSLHRENGKWRLWFDYWLPGKGVCMGYAENDSAFTKEGGFIVRHDLKKPLLTNWPNPEVVCVDNMYHCFSDPPGYPIKPGESQWKSRQLREAVSTDGINWKRLPFIKPDDDTDACHVPQALVTTINGKRWLYLFYATQIGYGLKDGRYHFQYDRIRAMRRPVGDSK